MTSSVSFASVNPNSAMRNLSWYRRRDSNPHCLVPKTSASSQLGYAGMKDFGFRISETRIQFASEKSDQIRNPNFEIRNVLVDLARFERATSTFARSRSDSAELQVQRFGIAECGLRIYETANQHSAIRNQQSVGGGDRS